MKPRLQTWLNRHRKRTYYGAVHYHFGKLTWRNGKEYFAIQYNQRVTLIKIRQGAKWQNNYHWCWPHWEWTRIARTLWAGRLQIIFRLSRLQEDR